ncbi:MAG: methionine--tRNA ligase subunit beta [Candidatus Aenigmarchaeota archaeon]|nr:methionine--tRNA ligase subunit beta [Candidatus Aenigmarchaeota archaeon]
MISFKDFKKIEMRVGTVEEVLEIPNSKNLLKFQVDIGGSIKQAIAGIKGYYKPEELEGKQFIFVTNLEPAKLMGELSEIMILAAVEGNKVVLIKPEKEISNGAIVE